MAIPFRLRKIPKVDDLTKLKNVHYERTRVCMPHIMFFTEYAEKSNTPIVSVDNLQGGDIDITVSHSHSKKSDKKSVVTECLNHLKKYLSKPKLPVEVIEVIEGAIANDKQLLETFMLKTNQVVWENPVPAIEVDKSTGFAIASHSHKQHQPDKAKLSACMQFFKTYSESPNAAAQARSLAAYAKEQDQLLLSR